MMPPRFGSKRMKKTSSKKSKVGLREIASAANVSVATASRVLSGNTRVDRDIQKKVLEQAKKLGIDPAQRNKTKTLAFLLSNRAMLHAFHSRILSGAEAHCTANGWDMVFLSFQLLATRSLDRASLAQSAAASRRDPSGHPGWYKL